LLRCKGQGTTLANTLKIFSWIGLCAAVPFISALCVQGLIILNSETYVPERWHSTLLMWAFLTIPVLCNVFGRKLLKAVEIMGGILHVIFFIVTVTTLAVMARRSTAEFVFTESWFGASGWESEGIQWCIGLLSITSVLTGRLTKSFSMKLNSNSTRI
jgi:choline transport protein